MKILFVCSIFPPDIGGPAIYAENLTGAFKESGDTARAVTGKKARSIVGIAGEMRYADICYVLSSSPALLIPSYIATRIRKKKIAVRIGGDFLWERSFESGQTGLDLETFYKKRKKSFKEKIIFFVLRYFLARLDFIIFTSDFQRNIYIQNYNVKQSSSAVIENPFPQGRKVIRTFPGERLTVLYAGRLLKLKNLETLIYAFRDLKSRATDHEIFLKIIGEGPERNRLWGLVEKLSLSDSVVFSPPLSHPKLLEEITRCWIAVIPSYSEVSPNFALESLACGTPIILTKESGLPRNIIRSIITFDPSDGHALATRMNTLIDEDKWLEYQSKIMKADTGRSLADVAREHKSIFQGI
jgi:glycosyltransferase involved in cell wall biosynthesis